MYKTAQAAGAVQKAKWSSFWRLTRTVSPRCQPRLIALASGFTHHVCQQFPQRELKKPLGKHRNPGES